MDPLTISAASGLRSRMESLEMLANNLANASTDGYKTDREGYSLYLAPEAMGTAGSNPDPQVLPVLARNWTDFSQGLLRATGNPLDVALSGRGFFTVRGPSGALFTRNGSFQIAASGQLVTAEGYPVTKVGGGPIQMQSSSPFEVTADGVVQQDGQVLGQLAIADFPDTASLAKVGKNYFSSPDPNLKPGAAAETQVYQGKLENSNANVAESAVRLIGVMRQFEMLQKAMALGTEMNRKAVEEVARVGS